MAPLPRAASPVLLLCALFFLSLNLCNLSASPPNPRALFLPLTKDPSTLQYVTKIKQRTPPTLLSLVVDLGARYTWVDCDSNYTSLTFRPVPCQSHVCSSSPNAGCGPCLDPNPSIGCAGNDTCFVLPGNPYTATNPNGELSEDTVSLQSTDGTIPTSPITIPRVAFSCAPSSLTQGLAAGSAGMAGFGRTNVSFPSQFASKLGLAKKFAVCLPSAGRGVAFFGDAGRPYNFLPGVEISPQSLTYTPLVTNPRSVAGAFMSHEPSFEYFVKLKSVRVNGKPVKLNSTLLSINEYGFGGTKISTVDPYTVLETSIYRAVVGAFAKESGLRRVAPVKPFGACFDGRRAGSTRVGLGVPAIDLVVGGEAKGASAMWRVFGANSMVEVRPGVLCLGFVDGGVEPKTAVVVGGHQLEDNLLEFDLAGSKLGFSGTLLFRQTNCANFNFTAAA